MAERISTSAVGPALNKCRTVTGLSSRIAGGVLSRTGNWEVSVSWIDLSI
ncbi:hypothetical protein HF838_16110 [Aneurinibacillus aneurinilyticus]|uniref:Uncharacterized protein n=1 Tax=Aneurinibacillus aneurinilyticus TaxID=1391 RepID=A0A848CZ40_ANEAE|nr:hypothetical protein [Aneurinibacillus aneurinilyticus]